MAYLSPTLNVMLSAAKKTGRLLVRDFGEVEQLQVSMKGTNDFVSAADTKAEQTLYRELKKARPDFGFLLEEGGAEEGHDKDSRWIIDPLDGTTNFLHGIPHFSISIALERMGEIMAGHHADLMARHPQMRHARALAALTLLYVAGQEKERGLLGVNKERLQLIRSGLSMLGDPKAAGQVAVLFEVDGPETRQAFAPVVDIVLGYLGFCAREKLDPRSADTAAQYAKP